MRLIDADDLIFYGMTDDISQAQAEDIVANAPTIDAEPVRRGRWIWDDEGYHCSECFFHAYGATLECMDGTYKYCPSCGAKMEEQE